jgi:hypothetical protein
MSTCRTAEGLRRRVALLGPAVEDPLSKFRCRSELARVIGSDEVSLAGLGVLARFPYGGVESSAEVRVTGTLAVGGLSV